MPANDQDKDTIDQKGEGNKPKHVRHRKRKLRSEIREQMEFYFGDANLSKDRYIMQLIKEDPYVPLDIFLTFNKLKRLTTSVEEIAKSLSNSEILELDEERKKVRRKTEIPRERDVDGKTLYVESVPSTADHDWVKKVFSKFGKVTYVSLPKYQKSRKIKEFGFVEFEQEASLEKALKAFAEFNGVLSTEKTDPGKLVSVTSYVKEQQGETNEDENEKRKSSPEKVEAKQDDEEGPPTKRLKTNSEDETKDEESESETADSQSDEDATETNEPTDKEEGKKKKRRKKKKRKAGKPLDTETDWFQLRILPKKEWKRLRNKYLNLQREKVAELKRQAWKNSQNAQQSDTPNQQKVKKVPAENKKIEKMNMNFYGANTATPPPVPTPTQPIKNPALEKAPHFTYEPGLIVAVKFLEPCVNTSEFKADMKQYETVKYVDIKEGAFEAFLRCDSPKNAQEFVKQINCAEYNSRILSGDAETEYWKKIMADREMKLLKKVKIPQKRGRERVKKIITKHIRFGDDDE